MVPVMVFLPQEISLPGYHLSFERAFGCFVYNKNTEKEKCLQKTARLHVTKMLKSVSRGTGERNTGNMLFSVDFSDESEYNGYIEGGWSVTSALPLLFVKEIEVTKCQWIQANNR
jgi:hypothetical protein